LRLAAILSLGLAAGCGPQQSVKPAAPVTPPNAAAEAHLRSGDFLGAATEFTRLANSVDGDRASRYRMMAALAYIDGEDFEHARTLLSAPPPEGAIARQLHALALASDGLASNPSAAAGQLESVDSRKLTPYQRSVYYRTLGRLAIVDKDYPAAATAFITADVHALPDNKRSRLHSDIWLALSHMDAEAITAAQVNAQRRENGWLALAAAARPNLHNNAALAAAIETWRAEYPQHAANQTLVEQLFELSESLSSKARHIALLLPLKGPYAAPANAIRNGFLSAWYAQPKLGTRPTVSIYAVDAGTINSVYDRAVANGADLIVGPLEKSTVETLAARPELPVRTLALNAAPTTAGGKSGPVGAANFFQFGLIPEDEAEQVAEKSWADGHSRAVALGPDSPWGTRLLAAFSERWHELGGTLLTQATYDSSETSYSASVKQALNVDLSEARAAELRRALKRRIEFDARRRADVDAIFLAGFPLGARQLLPQLRYFRAESIPVYATSHAYAGRENAAADQDLDGLRISDMPWLFGAADFDSFELFNGNWPDSAPGAGRLFAFGIDAYRMLPYLARMRHQPSLRIPGATGLLRMDADGRVFRNLTWVRFAGGVPNLMDR
jgi:hypothetical protein